MQNQYWGATQSILGASYLDTKAILNIQEGYKIGATTEYIDLGNYEVEGFANSGVFSQTLQLNAHNPVKRLDYNSSIVARSFDNHHVWYDGFDDSDTLQRNYYVTDSGVWDISSGYLRARFTSDTASNLVYTDNKNISDVRIIIKFKSDDWGGISRFSIMARIGTSVEKGDYDAYTLMARGTNNEIRLYSISGAAGTVLDSAAYTFVNNTVYWLMFILRGNKLEGYLSTDGLNYTRYVAATDSTYSVGGVGIRAESYGSANANYDIYDLDIVEIGNQYTTENILKNTLAMGGVFDTWVQPELNGVSGFEATTGSCWVVGSTDGYQQVDLYNTTGQTLSHLYSSEGATFDNFVAECEIKGMSGNFAGFAIGSTSKFYGGVIAFRGNYQSSFVQQQIGTNQYLWRRRGPYFFPQQALWYKVKMVKNNLFIGWYVNDVLINSIYGVSLPSSDGIDNNVMLFGRKAGCSGQLTSFRDLKISKLDDLVDDVQINPNTPLSSTFNRYLPKGYAVNWSGSTVEIFEIGASKGEFGISQYIQDSGENISNITGEKIVLARGKNRIGRVDNENSRVTYQLDSSRVKYIQDQNIKSSTDGINIATTDIESTNRNIQPYSCSITPRVDLEQYDTVNLIDSGLGISKQMIVQNFSKTYSAGDGSFRQTLQLSEK